MRTLAELKSVLPPADLTSRHAQEAAWFMASKGYAQKEPIGALEVDGGCYFYYEIGRERPGLVELEVVRVVDDELGREFRCTVTLYRDDCA